MQMGLTCRNFAQIYGIAYVPVDRPCLPTLLPAGSNLGTTWRALLLCVHFSHVKKGLVEIYVRT